MTHEDDTRGLVRRAGDVVPVTPAPVQALLQQGRGARRRRTVTAIGVVAASVAVITSGAVAVGAQLVPNSAEPLASRPTTPVSPDVTALNPPPGMRYVGGNGIAIAISENMLYTPSRFPVDAGQIRWAMPQDPSTRNDFPPQVGPMVSIGPIEPSSVEFYAQHAYSIGRINGSTVRRYGPYRAGAWADWVPAFPHFEGALWSRKADVFIWVTARSQRRVAAILDSVAAIPSSYVVLPSHPTAMDLSRLGLKVRPVYPYCVRQGPGANGTRPPPGSVVPRGSTVIAYFC